MTGGVGHEKGALWILGQCPGAHRAACREKVWRLSHRALFGWDKIPESQNQPRHRSLDHNRQGSTYQSRFSVQTNVATFPRTFVRHATAMPGCTKAFSRSATLHSAMGSSMLRSRPDNTSTTRPLPLSPERPPIDREVALYLGATSASGCGYIPPAFSCAPRARRVRRARR